MFTIILAGGQGQRLSPLTKDRSKSAVPFGGKYRIVDFVLSNCINSGLRQIAVLIQYRSSSLMHHIQEGWHISLSGFGDEYIHCVPAQQKDGNYWYRGTADAIRQNLDIITAKKKDHTLILSGDHIYKMNYDLMLDFHREHDADLTMAAVRVSQDVAMSMGVLEANQNWEMIGFEEKPAQPKTIDGDAERSLISMGVYIFKTSKLIEVLQRSHDDFGKDVIPYMQENNYKIFIYDYESRNRIRDYVAEVSDGVRHKVLVKKTRDSAYWRDVGNIESYYEASMDLIGIEPSFNLYGEKWPFRTFQRELPPTKFVLGGMAQESILSEGCIISGGSIWRSILSPEVIVEMEAVVEESILFDKVTVEPGAKVRRAIIDKGVTVCSGTRLGYDIEADLARGCTVSQGGIVVVPRDLTIGRC
ncbi:MAG TPA: glucose-1-phosphate adenylyltransferase [Dehalococcoidia bacterium]|nr:glucose-1-phosphate adenylyltransferase [Dehalococcoidia bacterium]